jgi:hypothetical protein
MKVKRLKVRKLGGTFDRVKGIKGEYFLISKEGGKVDCVKGIKTRWEERSSLDRNIAL